MLHWILGYTCIFQLWFPQGISPVVGLLGHMIILGFPGGSECKESPCNAGDLGLISELGRSPREGNDYSLQYSCLENPMDGKAWWATVHGSQTAGYNWATSLSPTVSEGSLFFTPPPECIVCRLLMMTWVRWYHSVVLISISLIMSDLSLLSCICCQLHAFFGEMSV